MSMPWPNVPLREVLIEEREKIGSFDGDSLPVLGVTNIDGVTYTGIEASADKSDYFRLRPNRFVYNPYRINVGSLGLSSAEQDGIVSPAYVVFGTNEHLNAQFLLYFLKSAQGNQLINFHGNRGSVRSALRFTDLCDIEIPLPPLEEQRRIVARIGTLAAQIAEVRSLRHQATEEAAALVPARTSQLFDGLGQAPKESIRTLGQDGSNPVQTGPFGAQLHASEFVESGVPVLNVGNVWPTGLRLQSIDYISPAKASQLSRYSLKPGDLLFARSGATLGKVCLVPPSCDGWLMSGHLFRVRFDETRMHNRFAFSALRGARVIHDQIFGQVRGATRPGFNTTLLGNVELPVPPLPEQRRIVAYLDGLQSQVDALKRLQAETAAELAALLPSILDRAFKGEF